MERIGSIPLIEVRGDARERGRQHGEAARARIDTAIGYYRESYVHTAGLAWPDVLERVPRWVPLIEAYLPGVLDEVRGIAEGAGRPFEEVLALNARGEMTAGNPFQDEGTASVDGSAKDDGCSSYAVTDEASGDGHVYCGQNWDWRSGVNDTVILLRVVQPPRPTIVMQVEAGQVGRHGANSAGIALNANGLGVRFGKGLGIPQPFIRRRILDATNLYEALEAVFTSHQSICTNLLLSHRAGEVIDVETTPGSHNWLYPEDGILVHTNHFQGPVPVQVADTYRPFSVDSLYRLTRIRRVLKQAPRATTPEAMRDLIASALRDHFGYPDAVCNHAQPARAPVERTETIASSIVDLTSGEYYLAPGLPCTEPYVKLPWNLYQDTPDPPAPAAAGVRYQTASDKVNAWTRKRTATTTSTSVTSR